MFANARRGKVNYSNNPTYLNFSSSIDSSGDADPNVWVTTSSFSFEESTDRTIVNFVSSSALDFSASFKRQVYISRVGIYDDNKNLIGVATLSNPIRKAEDEDLTFKIKLDI
jgi:ligand-binding sensor domain-containing protein